MTSSRRTSSTTDVAVIPALLRDGPRTPTDPHLEVRIAAAPPPDDALPAKAVADAGEVDATSVVPDTRPPPGLTAGEGRTSAAELLSGALASAAAVAVGAGAALVEPDTPLLPGLTGGEGRTSATELLAGSLAPAPPVAVGAGAVLVVPDTAAFPAGTADAETGPDPAEANASVADAMAEAGAPIVPDMLRPATEKVPADSAGVPTVPAESKSTLEDPAEVKLRGQTDVTLPEEVDHGCPA